MKLRLPLLLLFGSALACTGAPEPAVHAPPEPRQPTHAPPEAAPAAPVKTARLDSDGHPLPDGGCEVDGVVYDAEGTPYGCIGGGNWCSHAKRHTCTPAELAR